MKNVDHIFWDNIRCYWTLLQIHKSRLINIKPKLQLGGIQSCKISETKNVEDFLSQNTKFGFLLCRRQILKKLDFQICKKHILNTSFFI